MGNLDKITDANTTWPDKGPYDDENPIIDAILPRQADNVPVLPALHQPMLTNSSYIRDYIFKEFDATLLTSPSKYHTLSLDGNARALNILPGASFIACCSNVNYHDSITPVIINKGFYPDSNGLFTLNEEVSECGICKQIISDQNSIGIGFTNCKVVIKYRDTRQVADTFSLEAGRDVFKFAKFSLDGDTKFYFVKFNIDKLS